MSVYDVVENWLRTYLAWGAYRRTFDNLKLRGDERVLELGVGGGHSARVLLRRLGPGGHLTGIDVDEWWLQKARRKLGRHPNAEVLLGDVRELPLEDGSFDLAVVHITLHDIPREDRAPIVQALAGKLRPGGRLFIKEPTKEPHGMPAREIWDLMEAAGLECTARVETRTILLGPIAEGEFVKSG